MSLGKTPDTEDLFRSARALCEPKLQATSLYRLLAEQGSRLFADESFADLFQQVGRDSVPPRVVATVMVLQRIEGASDREAVDRLSFDLRWKYAAGVDLDFPSFAHTVLVNMRARLRRSDRPNRIFEVVLEVAKEAGLVGRKRVLDSTALFDAVATQDTVTMIRAAIRAVLKTASKALGDEIRAQLLRDDDYAQAGKPSCDWQDAAEREALVDALARDGHAVIKLLEGRALDTKLHEAVQLLTTVLGQDIVLDKGANDDDDDDTGSAGSVVVKSTVGDAAKGAGGDCLSIYRIAERVAPNRVVSTVDTDARHGRKTSSHKFTGYKGHIAIDPDSEIITATAVTPANVGDAGPAEELLRDILPPTASGNEQSSQASTQPAAEPAEVYGDASYGTADLVERLEAAGIEANTKVQPPAAREGMFPQDAFCIDLEADTVRCPAGTLVSIRRNKDEQGRAHFGQACKDCPLKTQCTKSKRGRTILVHPKHGTLDRARKRQRDPQWKRRYTATRPKVERKFAHLMRPKHGARRARVRGTDRVAHDFSMLAAATNLKRIAKLGVTLSPR